MRKPAQLFKRADELTALGLDIPLTAKISRELAKSGIIIDSDCTVNGFCEGVAVVYKGGANA